MTAFTREGAAAVQPAVTRVAGVSLEWLAGWLLVAVAGELLILRTATRIAIHVPGLHRVAGPYEAFEDVGRFAYYAAALLAVVTAFALAATAWGLGGLTGRWLAGALMTALAAAGLLRLTGPEMEPLLSTAMLTAITLAGCCAVVAATSQRARGVMALIVGAVALSGLHTVSQTWASQGAGGGLPSGLLDGAEVGAVAFAVALPWAWSVRWERRMVVGGGLAGLVVATLLLGNPYTSRFLMLWTHGLTGSLPSVTYALAGAALASTATALFARKDTLLGLGLLLGVAGGVAMQNTYQSMLVVVAFGCIALAMPQARTRSE